MHGEVRQLADPIAERLLVVAPHPDDETLGCGGLIAAHVAQGATIHILFVTDGGASHPNSTLWPRPRLAAERKLEAIDALRRLGAGAAERTYLHLADAGMSPEGSPEWLQARNAVEALLARFLPDMLLVPWRRDPHRDHRDSHRLVSAAVEALQLRPSMLKYAIWLVELGAPEDFPHPGKGEMATFAVSGHLANKRHAVEAHASQRGRLIVDDPTGFVLSDATVERLVTATERYFCPRP